ncbi:MAG: GDP-mannose 4,6-dehydratase [Candidatus Zixiibacteriota bacterium]
MCGFAGSWLAEELLNHGYYVRGVALPGESDINLRHIPLKIKIDRFDITDPESCKDILNRVKPDYLFHLAAMSSVGKSFTQAERTFKVNVDGTINIFDAAKNKSWLKKLIFVSSSDVYGLVKPSDLPLKSSQIPNPMNPYSQSKVVGEYLSKIYFGQFGTPIVIVRAFNHTGPRQRLDFAIPSFSRKIAKAETSPKNGIITVGNLLARRDLSDVRDIVRGYRMLAEKGRSGEIYQLCSGRDYRIGDLLKKLVEMSDKPIRIKKDMKLFRKSDLPVLRGSYNKVKKEIGWKPEIPLKATMADTLEYWRKKIAR